MNKRGFTMMEFLVYMAIVGAVVIIAGNAFSDSTRFRVQSESMIKANQEAEALGVLFRDDVSRMGMKSIVEKDSISGVRAAGLYVKPEVYMNLYRHDYSSFKYYPGKGDSCKVGKLGKREAGKDSLVLRKVVVNDSDGTFLRVEEISWYLNCKEELKRTCKTIVGTQDLDNCPQQKAATIDLASGVTRFAVTPANPSLLEGSIQMFPVGGTEQFSLIAREDTVNKVYGLTIAPPSGGVAIGMKGLITNYNNGNPIATKRYHQVFVGNAGEVATDWRSCQKFTFNKDTTYEVSFRTPFSEDFSRMFRPAKDHFTVGLRTVENGVVKPCSAAVDMMIFPPLSDETPDSHRLRFIPDTTYTNVCVAFTMAFFSPTLDMGSINIAELKVKAISDRNYVFGNYLLDEDDDEKVKQKANVRAFKLDLQVRRNKVSGSSVMVVPVPSNGVAE